MSDICRYRAARAAKNVFVNQQLAQPVGVQLSCGNRLPSRDLQLLEIDYLVKMIMYLVGVVEQLPGGGGWKADG